MKTRFFQELSRVQLRAGDEVHHSGWNVCSSCHDKPGLKRFAIEVLHCNPKMLVEYGNLIAVIGRKPVLTSHLTEALLYETSTFSKISILSNMLLIMSACFYYASEKSAKYHCVKRERSLELSSSFHASTRTMCTWSTLRIRTIYDFTRCGL